MPAPALLTAKARPRAAALTYTFAPRNLFMHADPEALGRLQARDTAFLRTLDAPARFVLFHRPASLAPLVEGAQQCAAGSARRARELAATGDPAATRTAAEEAFRAGRSAEYAAFYRQLEREGQFLEAVGGFALWKPLANPAAMAARLGALFGPAEQAPWPPLLDRPERYELRAGRRGLWYLQPVGYPAGRPLVTFLRAFDFLTVPWSYHQPLNDELLTLKLPLAICWDIPYTYPKADAVAAIEAVADGYRASLLKRAGEDSKSAAALKHCTQTVAELREGGLALHRVRLRLALFAETVAQLETRVEKAVDRLAGAVGLAPEVGHRQRTAYRYFTSAPSAAIEPLADTHPMTSALVAVALGPLGLALPPIRPGVLYGINALGQPVFRPHWVGNARPALHTTVVGKTGAGKTYFVNTHLARCWAADRVPFTLIEPLGHGRALGEALGVPAFTVDPATTVLNPLDPVYTLLGDQVDHALRVVELLLDRALRGDERRNKQRAVLGAALHLLYLPHDLATLTPDGAPTMPDLLTQLRALAETEAIPALGWRPTADLRAVSAALAEELAGLLAGNLGYFTSGHTAGDLSPAGAQHPRIYCLDRIGQNPTLIALAYLQIFAAEWRDGMRDDRPRIIVLDEVRRMDVHPALPAFILRAVKTLRTKRKRLILVDQDIDTFLAGDMQMVFSNCPYHVYFNQSGNEPTFNTSERFARWSARHRQLLSTLGRGEYLLETPDGTLQWLYNQTSAAEFARFGHT